MCWFLLSLNFEVLELSAKANIRLRVIQHTCELVNEQSFILFTLLAVVEFRSALCHVNIAATFFSQIRYRQPIPWEELMHNWFVRILLIYIYIAILYSFKMAYDCMHMVNITHVTVLLFIVLYLINAILIKRQDICMETIMWFIAPYLQT